MSGQRAAGFISSERAHHLNDSPHVEYNPGSQQCGKTQPAKCAAPVLLQVVFDFLQIRLSILYPY
jgi:hypothetical protein